MVSLKSSSCTTLKANCVGSLTACAAVQLPASLTVAVKVQAPSGQQPPSRSAGGGLPCTYWPVMASVDSHNMLPRLMVEPPEPALPSPLPPEPPAPPAPPEPALPPEGAEPRQPEAAAASPSTIIMR